MARATKCYGVKYPEIQFASKFERDFYESIPDGVFPRYENRVYNWVKETVNNNRYARMSDSFKEVSVRVNRRYTPDINIVKRSDPLQYNMHLELKGYLDAGAKERLTMFRKLFPDADVRIVFYVDKKIGKKMTYLRWAELRGFKACIARCFEQLPEDWKEEIYGR